MAALDVTVEVEPVLLCFPSLMFVKSAEVLLYPISNRKPKGQKGIYLGKKRVVWIPTNGGNMLTMRYCFLIALTLVFSFGQQVEYREAAPPNAAGSMQAPIAFSALGARWDATISPLVRVRASIDGQSWTPWTELKRDLDSGLPTSSLAWLGQGVRFLEWDNSTNGVTFVFIDPGITPVSMKNQQPIRSIEAGKPPVISRTDWGCPDGQNYRGTPNYTTVTHLIVHHTADGPVADYAAWIRAIWTFHVFSNKWDDIGYNYLVAPDGRIFEGRAGGDNVLGAHFSGQNGSTMGVSVLGTYTKVLPTAPALDSLEQILAWKADKQSIDPLGVRLHPGTRLYLMNISGHRDANPSPFASGTTECPGDLFYPTLPQLRQRVAARLNAIHTATLLSEDAESQGANWVATGLWHISEEKQGHVWWFGNEATGTYDIPGSASSGTLESPAFEVSSDATLSFATWYETENPAGDWDKKIVEVSVNGGPWEVVDQLLGIERQWITRSYPLPGRGSLRVRFRFDSVDSTLNSYRGWLVDDIRVTVRQ